MRRGSYLSEADRRNLARLQDDARVVRPRATKRARTPRQVGPLPTLAFADEDVADNASGLCTFAANSYTSAVRGTRQVTFINRTGDAIVTDDELFIEYYSLENGGGAWIVRPAGNAMTPTFDCNRDRMLNQIVTDAATVSTSGTNPSQFTLVNATQAILPSWLDGDTGIVYDSLTGIYYATRGYYLLEAQVDFFVDSFSGLADVEVFANFQMVPADITVDRPRVRRQRKADGQWDTLSILGFIPAKINPTFKLIAGVTSITTGERVTGFVRGRNILITRLVDCSTVEGPIVPPDLCDFTTLAYLWESDENYVVAATNVWSVSNASCTLGITFERAVATAPTNLGTINAIAVLDFDGTQLLDMVGATNLPVDNSNTLKEIWLSWNHNRKNSTLVEYVLRGDNSGIDGIGRNEYGYLQVEMTSVETEFGKLCLADGLPHVLRIEVTAANTYRLTLDNYYTHTLDTTNDIAIDGIGQAQGGSLDFEGQLMDLYFAEALTDEQAASTWDYMMTRIGAAAQFFTVPDGTDSVLNDQFLTDDAAPVTTPRTCEPGPGTLTWLGGDESDFGIANQQLTLIGTGSTTLSTGFYGDPFTRQAGLRMEAHLEMADGTQEVCYIGWLKSTTSATSAMEGGLYISNAINSHFGWGYYSGIQTQFHEFLGWHVGYQSKHVVSVVLRASGFHVFAEHCGQLKHIRADNRGTTASVRPGLINGDGDFSLDFFRVRGSLWTPTPDWSDSFTRGDSTTIGDADDAGVEESGGQLITWSEVAVATGDAQIVSNQAANVSTTAGDRVFVLGEASPAHADVHIEATLECSDWVAIVFNYVDSNNYWFAILNASDGAGNDFAGSSGADFCELYRVTSGTETRIDGVTISGSVNKGTSVQMWALVSDDSISVDFFGASTLGLSNSVNTLRYRINDRPHKTGTQHGLLLDNQVGADVSACDAFGCWPVVVTDYDAGASGSVSPPAGPTLLRSYVTVALLDDDSGDYRCDGTDDDVQIQAALDEVESAGGGTVFIKGGTYDIGAVLDIADDIELEGTPNTILKKQASSGTANVINVVSRSNVRINNLQVDGNKANNAASDYFNINIFECDKVAIDNVTTYNANRASTEGEGIRIAGSDHVTCYACRAYSNGGVGIKWTTSSGGTNRSQYCTASMCEAWSNGSDGILMFECDGGKIENCIAHENGDDGITLHGEETTDTGPKYSEIVGCISYLNTEDGIVACTSGDSCVCNSNTSYENGQQGINFYFHAKHSVVNGNTCKFNGYDGIFMQGQSATPPLKPTRYSIVSDNNCFDNGYAGSIYSGIRVAFGAQNLIIDSNICTCTDSDNPNGTPPNQRYGINIQDEYCRNVRITNNVLDGNRLGAINDAGTNTYTFGNGEDTGPGDEDGVFAIFLPGDDDLTLHGTNPPQQTTRATTNYSRDVLNFDDTTNELCAWGPRVMPYSHRRQGVYVDIYVTSVGDDLEPEKMVFKGSFERSRINESDLDIDGFDTAKSVTIMSQDTVDTIVVGTISFDNDEMDDIRPGEAYRFQLECDAVSSAHTVTGDSQVIGVYMRQRGSALESFNLLLLTAESVVWQADTNYETNGSLEQWTPINYKLLRFERATATAPATREVNGLTALDFAGAERLDGFPTSDSPLFPLGIKNTGTTHTELWITFQFDAATGEEYLITGNDGGTTDGIGRNSSDQLVIRMSDVDTAFTSIDLGDTLPHVLRIENTGTLGQYRCTLDDGTPQTLTLGSSGEVAIEGLGVQQDGSNFFDGAIMHLWLNEGLTTAQADYAWDYLLRQIGA